MSKSSTKQTKVAEKSFAENRRDELMKTMARAKQYVNETPIEDGPATKKQIEFLKKYGKKVVSSHKTIEGLTKNHASRLIDEIHSEKVSPKQADLLARNGYSQSAIANMSRLQASIAISKLVSMTPAQAQTLQNSGIDIQGLRDKKIYLTKSEASSMIREIYKKAN